MGTIKYKFVALNFHKWGNPSASGAGIGTGFLPVYDKYIRARLENPGCKIIKVKAQKVDPSIKLFSSYADVSWKGPSIIIDDPVHFENTTMHKSMIEEFFNGLYGKVSVDPKK